LFLRIAERYVRAGIVMRGSVAAEAIPWFGYIQQHNGRFLKHTRKLTMLWWRPFERPVSARVDAVPEAKGAG
jgi:hypothetical protein